MDRPPVIQFKISTFTRNSQTRIIFYKNIVQSLLKIFLHMCIIMDFVLLNNNNQVEQLYFQNRLHGEFQNIF